MSSALINFPCSAEDLWRCLIKVWREVSTKKKMESVKAEEGGGVRFHCGVKYGTSGGGGDDQDT